MALTEIHAGQFLVDSSTRTPWRVEVLEVNGGWAKLLYHDAGTKCVGHANVRQVFTYYALLHKSVDAAHEEALRVYGNYPCTCGAIWVAPQELVACRSRH